MCIYIYIYIHTHVYILFLHERNSAEVLREEARRDDREVGPSPGGPGRSAILCIYIYIYIYDIMQC